MDNNERLIISSIARVCNLKEKEIRRSETVAKGPQNIFAKSSYFLTSLGTSFLDPINIAASFVPVVGQAKFANMVAKSGKNIARLKLYRKSKVSTILAKNPEIKLGDIKYDIRNKYAEIVG